MKSLLLCVFMAFTVVAATQTYLSDDSNGGADCTTDAECSAPNGVCEMSQSFGSNGTGICVCTEKYTDPFCSYEMYDKKAAAGLQWLCLIGIGGVGNFYIGRIGEGVGQFIMVVFERSTYPFLSGKKTCGLFRSIVKTDKNSNTAFSDLSITY